jgi:hypothetical protein
MKELASIFDEVLEHRKNKEHYKAGELILQTSRRLKIDQEDLLELLVDYVGAN